MEEESVYRGVGYKLIYSEFADNPRDWGCLSVSCLSHKKYKFPNETEINFQNFNSWDEVEEELHRLYPDIVKIEAVYMYEHGGIVLRKSESFQDVFDSGQLGFVFYTKSKAKDWLMKGLSEEEVLERADKVYQGEWKVYKAYAEGEVFEAVFDVPEIPNVEYYGSPDKDFENRIKEVIDFYWEEVRVSNQSKLKKYILTKVPFQYRKLEVIPNV